ncbi:MAG: hypothetical protein WHT26_03415 [Thermus sp.]|uniref:hypothetical protein n=1 Tax=Thermus sp. TaxID=275 RepID=UPI00309B1CBC
MEVLGTHWLRRIIARIPPLTVYEGQDTRTGTPVMVLKGAEGRPLEGPALLPFLEALEDAWVLEWPLGAVPLSHYLGVADLERLAVWVRAMAQALKDLEAQGVAYAPRAELCLVKGRRVWLAGAGLKALEGDGRQALLELAKALAGGRFEEFPLREALERGDLEALLAPQEAASEALPQEPPPEEPKKRPLPVEEEAPPEPPKAEPPPPSPSRPKVIRIEEKDEPPFPVVEPKNPGRRRILWLLPLLLVLLGLFLFRPRPQGQGPYAVEFRTEPPSEKAEVYLLEAPPGSRLQPGTLLLTAPGRAEVDAPGVYRLRIRVPGRDPVDYLLEVPGPPLTIRVR